MSSYKIFNDPVYGFISVPKGLILEIIDHPYFQRLRRISQLGLTSLVYPGANHTRFHHALGAFHLMTQAIDVLKSKSIEITKEEAEAASIAILLHDIGHGPFSHALEKLIIRVSHETLSLWFMESLNKEFNNKLDLAIKIFKNDYPKKFLFQLVSGQLDMDRMDYLNRDSFYTGVSEGVIGYDRIIKMLNVVGGELVVEEKGFYSIEKFLIARRLMYWQVYFHKASISAEQMLIQLFKRIKFFEGDFSKLELPEIFDFFVTTEKLDPSSEKFKNELLNNFSKLDDTDVVQLMKKLSDSEDFVLSFLCESLLERKLFKIELSSLPFESDHLKRIRQKIAFKFPKKTEKELNDLVLLGNEKNNAYSTDFKEIKILFKDGQVKLISQIDDSEIPTKIITKYFLCYPK